MLLTLVDMVKILTFSLNDEVAAELDVLQKKLSFSGRSETVRAALHLLQQETLAQEKLHGNLSAILVLTHPESRDDELAKIRHHYQKIIRTQLHDHLEGHRCMELLILKGDAKDLTKMARECSACKGVDAKLLPL